MLLLGCKILYNFQYKTKKHGTCTQLGLKPSPWSISFSPPIWTFPWKSCEASATGWVVSDGSQSDGSGSGDEEETEPRIFQHGLERTSL